MFKDYYAILEIDVSASQDDIKAAFKKQALRCHPDRNIGKDTTLIMQDINEAKLILLTLRQERDTIENTIDLQIFRDKKKTRIDKRKNKEKNIEKSEKQKNKNTIRKQQVKPETIR